MVKIYTHGLSIGSPLGQPAAATCRASLDGRRMRVAHHESRVLRGKIPNMLGT